MKYLFCAAVAMMACQAQQVQELKQSTQDIEQIPEYKDYYDYDNYYDDEDEFIEYDDEVDSDMDLDDYEDLEDMPVEDYYDYEYKYEDYVDIDQQPDEEWQIDELPLPDQPWDNYDETVTIVIEEPYYYPPQPEPWIEEPEPPMPIQEPQPWNNNQPHRKDHRGGKKHHQKKNRYGDDEYDYDYQNYQRMRNVNEEDFVTGICVMLFWVLCTCGMLCALCCTFVYTMYKLKMLYYQGLKDKDEIKSARDQAKCRQRKVKQQPCANVQYYYPAMQVQQNPRPVELLRPQQHQQHRDQTNTVQETERSSFSDSTQDEFIEEC